MTERRHREQMQPERRKRPPRDLRSYEERSADRRDAQRRRQRSVQYEEEFEERRPSKREIRRRKEEMRRKRRRKRIMVLVVEIIVLVVLCVVAYGLMKMDKINYNWLDKDKLEIYRDTGPYTNIALFGVDSRDGELESGVRSDSMMIASINNETNEVRIVSVYRDTLLKQEDGTFSKANSAYARGGAQAAIALMNRNLDLDIQNYICVNFNSLADIIDTLGGVEIDVTEEEVPYINQYMPETAEVVGKKCVLLEHGGLQNLNGVQAVTYSRIRSIGGDFQRTERQRLVLQKVAEKAQKADFVTLNKLMDQVFSEISTSFKKKELLGIAANALSYKLGEMSGFPFDIAGTDKLAGDRSSYVIPVGLAENVTQLHKFLFDEADYAPSEIVQSISDEICNLSGVYPEPETAGAE